MNREKKRNGLLAAIVGLSLLLFGTLCAELLVGIAARNKVADGTVVDTLIAWMGILFALLFLFAAGIVFCSIRREQLFQRSRWENNLFGKEGVCIDSDIEFEKKFRRAFLRLERTTAKEALKKKAKDEAYIVSFQLREVRGQEIANNLAVLHQINLLVSDELKKQFGGEDDAYGISERNDFFVYAEAKGGNINEMKDRFARFASSLIGAIDARNDLPSVIVLFGAAKGKLNENAAITLAHSEFALFFNAGTRLSGSMEIYSQAIVKENEGRKSLDEEIARALKRHELQIYYQGKWDLKKGCFYGAEALIRWKHPKRGILPPSSFIPYCENSGRIVEIDHYVFETVCKDIAKWRSEGRRKIAVSINLSRRSVYDPSLLSFLEKTCEDNHVSPKEIDIELTESLAAQNVVFISAIIRRIKALGFGTSMDDFGIGYSSLSSLKNIPFSVLKIDKSFIDDIEIDNKSRSMVRSIIELVHALGMKTIAEGVETADQVRILQSLGLDAIQGFYFSRPLERARFEAFLESNIFEPQSHSERKVQPHDPTRR